jgi:hypothetical protein
VITALGRVIDEGPDGDVTTASCSLSVSGVTEDSTSARVGALRDAVADLRLDAVGAMPSDGDITVSCTSGYPAAYLVRITAVSVAEIN